jgi:trk system potassium uptake protein TrkH
MNGPRILGILGRVLLILGGAQLLPVLFCLGPGQGPALRGFLIGAVIAASLGFAFRHFGSTEGELYRRDGVLIVVVSWLLASVTGAIPYLASGAIPGVVDAFFESASGFTTTGASILTDIEALDRGILFWRSFTQWLGGIGIVVLFVALLSELGPGARFLFKLEVPGPKAEILHARVKHTAAMLARIYVAISLAQAVVLMALGLDIYDALTHTFSTVSTGGFSPYAESAGHFDRAVQLAILVFMLAAGVNFSLYFAAVRSRSLAALRDTELLVYVGVALIASLVVALDIEPADGSRAHATLDAVFQVVSILTTTGFATADFAQWPALSEALLVGLMLIGGCAGSTAGGPKVIRILIAWRAAIREVRLTFSPNAVIAIAVGGKAVPEESVRAVVSLLLLWVAAWGLGTVLLAAGGTGVLTAATASVATLSNIGPGLELVGPAGNFAEFASWQKLVMVFLMWLGRLEFFAVLALLNRKFWQA